MEKYKKYAYYVLFATVGVILFYIFFKYVLAIIMPFLFSYMVVCVLRPLIDKICKKTRASRFFVTMFVLILCTAMFITASVLILIAISEQIGNIFDSIMENLSKENNVVTVVFDFLTGIEEKLPFAKKLSDSTTHSFVTEVIMEGVKSLSISLTGKITAVISSLPEIILGVFVIFLSLFYFAKDYDKIGGAIIAHLPPRIATMLPGIKNDIILVVTRYIKSYLLLLLITFAELFSGFMILDIENSFVLAIIISVVDFLPVLGVGTVLIPWSVILYIDGQSGLATGLLVLFGISYLVRQYAEPRIISAQMEVHPLVTLFAMYAGLKLAGLTGLIFAPLVAFIAKTVYRSYKKQLTSCQQCDNI